MMIFKENDKVVLRNDAHIVINDKDVSGAIGVVHKVFEDLGVAIVAFEGVPVKVPIEILNSYEEKNEDPGEKIITISREDFKKAVMKAVDPERLAQGGNEDMSPIALLTVGMTGMIICKDVEKILFGGAE